jgi:hypothetical protein
MEHDLTLAALSASGSKPLAFRARSIISRTVKGRSACRSTSKQTREIVPRLNQPFGCILRTAMRLILKVGSTILMTDSIARQRGVHLKQGMLCVDVRSFHAAKIGGDRSERLWRLRHNTGFLQRRSCGG